MPTRLALSALPAFAAVFSLSSTPILAAEQPLPGYRSNAGATTAWVPGDDTAHNHRWYRYDRHRRIDAGDILAGILIVGGIAAIAGAAKGERRDRGDHDNPEPYRERSRYDGEVRGIDQAASTCADEVERNARIDSIDAVNRTSQGWDVSGTLFNGEGFYCSVGNDGRVDAIDYGRGGAETYRGRESEQGVSGGERERNLQYDDDTYAQARAQIDKQETAQPSYPGGPAPGEGSIDEDPGDT